MILRSTIVAVAALSLGACSTQGKKPRLPTDAVVGMWRSDTLRAADTSRVYSLRMTDGGMAEFSSQVIGGEPAVARGTWDGADSLVRVVARGERSGARPLSMLLALRGNTMSLVSFDTAAWGPQGLTLVRR